MVAYILYKFLVPEIEYVGLFWVVFGAVVISLVLGIFFTETHEWKKVK